MKTSIESRGIGGHNVLRRIVEGAGVFAVKAGIDHRVFDGDVLGNWLVHNPIFDPSIHNK